MTTFLIHSEAVVSSSLAAWLAKSQFLLNKTFSELACYTLEAYAFGHANTCMVAICGLSNQEHKTLKDLMPPFGVSIK